MKVINIMLHRAVNRILIKRHRAINALLATELAGSIHALALHTYTEKEWKTYYAENTPLSPKCLGGSKKTS